MAEWTRIASVEELPGENEAKDFACGGRMICVARVDGELAAMDNVCVHRGGPLGQGVVMDGTVVCPWHGWQFDPKTGVSKQTPEMGVTIYKLKVEGDDVLVES